MTTATQTPVKTRLLHATLAGSDRRRGRQHGERFGAQVRESGILDFYRDFCRREAFRALPRPVGWSFDKLHHLFAARLSPETKELVAGFAEGAGLAYAKVSQGVAMPDVLNYLIGWSGRVLSAPTLGCTSAAAWGEYTEDGRLLYCRNLDFPGNGVWDRFPLVLRHRPDKGVPYVSVGAAGSIVDGITGVNEEGLSVALHQHMSTEVGLLPAGRSILDLGARVLQHARTLEQAVELCSKWRTTSGWSVVLTHWKEKRACVVHKTARRTAVRWSHGDSFVHTNTFFDTPLRATEIARPVFNESSRLRKLRAETVLKENMGRVDPVVPAGLLNDRLDMDRGLIRAFGQTIHQPHTVTSVVMDAGRGCLWVSEGAAPTAQGPYRRVELWEEAVGEETLVPNDPLPAAKRRAYAHYLDAYRAWQKDRDAAAANKELKKAVEADGDDPLYRQMRGLTALLLGDAEQARESFEAGAALPDIPHRGQAQTLWQARSLDLLGRRSEAVKLYGALAAAEPAAPLKAAAEKGRRQPCRRPHVLPDFIYADTYVY